jgi:hypothetical protein
MEMRRKPVINPLAITLGDVSPAAATSDRRIP